MDSTYPKRRKRIGFTGDRLYLFAQLFISLGGKYTMKIKLIEVLTFIIMCFTTQLPKLIFRSLFIFAHEIEPEAYVGKYVVTVLVWMIFFYYIVSRLRHYQKTLDS